MHGFLSPFVHGYYTFLVTTFDVVLICLFKLGAEGFFIVFEFAFIKADVSTAPGPDDILVLFIFCNVFRI